MAYQDAVRTEITGSRDVPRSSTLAGSFVQNLAGSIIGTGAASLNKEINKLLGVDVAESNAILESWSRSKILGSGGDVVDQIESAFRNLGDELKNEAIGALNQAVLETGEGITNALFNKKQDTLKAVNFDDEYYNMRPIYKNRNKDVLTNLGLFYNQFSSLNRRDKRFSLLQNYLFNVSLYIPNIDSLTSNNKTRFYNLYKDYLSINDNDNRAISILVNSMDLPNIAGEKTENFTTEFGHVSLPSNKILPDSNELSFKVLNTEDSLMESLFVEWLGETCSDRYIYSTVPFLKARVDIEFYHANRHERAFTYSYHDCFPTQIETQNPSHEYNINTTREVKMAFDYMTITNYNTLRRYNYDAVGEFDRQGITDTQSTNRSSNTALVSKLGSIF